MGLLEWASLTLMISFMSGMLMQSGATGGNAVIVRGVFSFSLLVAFMLFVMVALGIGAVT